MLDRGEKKLYYQPLSFREYWTRTIQLKFYRNKQLLSKGNYPGTKAISNTEALGFRQRLLPSHSLKNNNHRFTVAFQLTHLRKLPASVILPSPALHPLPSSSHTPLKTATMTSHLLTRSRFINLLCAPPGTRHHFTSLKTADLSVNFKNSKCYTTSAV